MKRVKIAYLGCILISILLFSCASNEEKNDVIEEITTCATQEVYDISDYNENKNGENIREVNIMTKDMPNKEKLDKMIEEYDFTFYFIDDIRFDEVEVFIYRHEERTQEDIRFFEEHYIFDYYDSTGVYMCHCDIDFDGEDERVFEVSTWGLLSDYDSDTYLNNIIIQKKDESGEYKTVFNSITNKSEDWFEDFKTLGVDSTYTVKTVSIDGKQYIAQGGGEYIRLYSYDKVKNELVLVYHYFLDSKSWVPGEFPEVIEAYEKFDGTAAEFVNANIAYDAIEKFDADKDNEGELSCQRYFDHLKYDLVGEMHADVYQCDIDDDGIDERVCIVYSLSPGSRRLVLLTIEKKDASGKYKIRYDHNAVQDALMEFFNFEFSYKLFDPKVININGSYYLAENRYGSLVISKYDDSLFNIRRTRYLKNPVRIVSRFDNLQDDGSISDKEKSEYDEAREINPSEVVHLSRQEGSRLIEKLGMDRSKFRAEIDGRNINSKRAFYFAVADALNFPKKFDGNDEDFLGYIKDLSWIENRSGVVLYINNIHKRIGRLNKDKIISILNDNILPYWSGKSFSFESYWVE